MFVSSSSGTTTLDSTSQSGKSEKKVQDDLNQFLNMLVTQLKNQDPLNPMDANQFTSQLVQFSSVEQQIYANAHLEKLVSLQQASQTAFMVDYIGRTVEATGNQVPLQDKQAEFSYVLEKNAANVQVTIQDSAGNTVFTATGDNTAGKHTIYWDGKDNTGLQHADGTYKVVVAAKDREGKLLDVTQLAVGKVTGAGNDSGTAILFMGDIQTTMDKIVTVRDAVQTADTTN